MIDSSHDECEHCELNTDLYFVDGSGETNPMAGISKETFEAMSVDSKLCVLFDYMQEIQQAAPKRVRDRNVKCALKAAECNKRFNVVEKQLKRYKVINTVAAFIGGFVGGWSAIWASFKLSLFNILK